MFKKSNPSTAPDLFNSISNSLEGSRYKTFSDPKAWHSLFHEHITSKIDEDVFKVLFDKKGNGRPNEPIRLLVSMMILKEGFGWSDKALYEQCHFNMLVMKALGLNNINDSIPCEATYYNFKRSLYSHQIAKGEDLVGKVFGQLTSAQARLFNVQGSHLRMDSKLIGSNIAKSTRLQLIINVVQDFHRDILKNKQGEKFKLLSGEHFQQLEILLKRKAGQIVYDLQNDQKTVLLEQLGYLLASMVKIFSEKDSSKYTLLDRLFKEQYTTGDERTEPKSIKEISSSSLQSPYDEDAAYRNKDGNQVRGYSHNLTETCNDKGLNLITDIEVAPSNKADCNFVEQALERSKGIVANIKHVNVDGAYHSPSNQQRAEKENIELICSGMQGDRGKYSYETINRTTVAVTNNNTLEKFEAKTYKEGKYKFKENGKYVYVLQTAIDAYFQRKKVAEYTKEQTNRRNNVEASLFQLSFFTRKNKTRYRGKIKNQTWGFCRCIWINLIRIKNHAGSLCPNESDGKLLSNLIFEFYQMLKYRNQKIGLRMSCMDFY